MPEFILGDKLPLVSEAVIAILSYAPGGPPDGPRQTVRRQEAVTAYINALIVIWSKAFGNENIASRKTVKTWILSHIKNYHSAVNGSKNKLKLTKRERIRGWRTENSMLLNILKKGVNPSSFDEPERRFLEGQNSPTRDGYISEEIDEEYEDRIAKRRNMSKQEQDKLAADAEEVRALLADLSSDCENENDDLNISMSTRSGRVLFITEDKQLQTDHVKYEQPPIRSLRKCTEQIKTVCAMVSSTAHISASKARVVVQVVCRYLYGHYFFLTVDEATSSQKGL